MRIQYLIRKREREKRAREIEKFQERGLKYFRRKKIREKFKAKHTHTHTYVHVHNWFTYN